MATLWREQSRKYGTKGATVLRRMALQRQLSLEEMADKLTNRRAELGLTQEEVALRVGAEVSFRTVQRWLNGETFPQDRNIYKLAKALELDPEELVVEPPTAEAEQRQLDRIESKLDDLLALAARSQVRRTAAKARSSNASRPAKKRRRAVG